MVGCISLQGLQLLDVRLHDKWCIIQYDTSGADCTSVCSAWEMKCLYDTVGVRWTGCSILLGHGLLEWDAGLKSSLSRGKLAISLHICDTLYCT
jgi:hypothetical protein